MVSLVPGIYGFFGDYRWLSNFWYHEVMLDGLYYPSTEHAYQAAKTLNPEERKGFRFSITYKGSEPNERTITCGQAKRLGSKITLRQDWEEIKVHIMEDLIRQKFQDQVLGEKLLATKDLYLEETNHWGDVFWGVCNGKGKNVLGNILMKVRQELTIKS